MCSSDLRTPRTQVEKRQGTSGRDDRALRSRDRETQRGKGRSGEEQRQGQAAADDLDQPGRHGISGKLGQGDDQGELEGLDQGETLLHQQRWNPDEGPVVGQVDAEPHQPERQGAAPQLLGEQGEPGRLDRLPPVLRGLLGGVDRSLDRKSVV